MSHSGRVQWSVCVGWREDWGLPVWRGGRTGPVSINSTLYPLFRSSVTRDSFWSGPAARSSAGREYGARETSQSVVVSTWPHHLHVTRDNFLQIKCITWWQRLVPMNDQSVRQSSQFRRGAQWKIFSCLTCIPSSPISIHTIKTIEFFKMHPLQF